jgi:hypothetical protein
MLRSFCSSSFYALLSLLLAWPLAAAAQQRTGLDDLLLPQSQERRLVYRKGKPVHLLLSQRSVEEVLLHYLKLSRGPDWKLTFPSQAESTAWLEALKKTRESKVFMLNLYHLKSKVNYSLTIGELENTRALSARSIITIYSMQGPFGS